MKPTTQFELVCDFILGNDGLSHNLRDYWAGALDRLRAGLPMERAFGMDLSNGRKRRDELIRLYAENLPDNSPWCKAQAIAKEVNKIRSKRGGSAILVEAHSHYRLPCSVMQLRRIIEGSNI